MFILRVGDPHAKINNLEEMEALLTFVWEKAYEHKVDRIEFLGDLFHTHAILRLEVLDFWTRWLLKLSQEFQVVVLVGNHDLSGDHNSTVSALSIFTRLNNQNLHIITAPKVMGVYGYLPYFHSGEQFVLEANKLVDQGAKVIVCHQTFDGSRFENGFYAPEGIDAKKINSEIIISGHIHATQEFGTVWYPGTPRWDMASDANQTKGIWLCQHDEQGKLISKVLVNTDKVCSPIVSITVHEGEEICEFAPKARICVELVGSSQWISKQKAKLKGKCSIKTRITDKVNSETRKSGNSLAEFLEKHFESKIKGRLIAYMKELGLV